MDNQTINANTPASLLADFRDATRHLAVPARSDWIYQRRVGHRSDASALDWLNDLLRGGVVGMGHLDNAMYCALLEGDLEEAQMQSFLQQYYWGSGYGFQRVVLPSAVKRDEGDVWRAYIKSIIHEENTPGSHCGIFKLFVESLGFDLGEMPPTAAAFNDRMLAGYNAKLGVALGYALGVETEADFQIALVYLALADRYPAQVGATDYFAIHLSEYGEEMHAQETCAAIEAMLAEGRCIRADVEAGFRSAIADTRDYMVQIHAQVRALGAGPALGPAREIISLALD